MTGQASGGPLLYFEILWVVLSTFNYGFGISELNPLQGVLSCPPRTTDARLPACLDLTSSQFGYVTAAFTLGGFLASLVLSPLRTTLLPSLFGRAKQALVLAAALAVIGGATQAASTSWSILALGRFFMGLGSGMAIVIVPSYLNDISPPALRGSIGVLNQLSIVTGILSAQGLGVSPLGENPSSSAENSSSSSSGPWRAVPLISASVALLQILLAPLALDSPSDVDEQSAVRIRSRLWAVHVARGRAAAGEGEGEEEEQAALLAQEPDADTSSVSTHAEEPSQPVTMLTLVRLLVAPSTVSAVPASKKAPLRKGVALIAFTQLAQQLSGVNAVLYYSTGILSDVFHSPSSPTTEAGSDSALAKKIALGITLVNALMTFPPIYLIRESRLGRKKLLLLSSGLMSLSSLLLCLGITRHGSLLSAASLVVFVAAFSAGLGPIPFLILPELVASPTAADAPTRAAAASFGIALNWLANVALASLFLPLRQLATRFDGQTGGSVFLLFTLINAATAWGVSSFYAYHGAEQDDDDNDVGRHSRPD
ncbi:general substrate transporter [Acaromyces ingoldii]|uniref:General substrate transporter n=1 Tax=Acaromyces ingoldii TaxID=215250 RepID=A0A316YP28_9BASI|nr:general substrate transporter [Acaromyces ingoldii]PWN90981.1 general substrate transporter [Acaromyces ingoldii]